MLIMKKLKLTPMGSLDRHAGITRCQERGGRVCLADHHSEERSIVEAVDQDIYI